MNRPRFSLFLMLPMLSLSCRSSPTPQLSTAPVVQPPANHQTFENQSMGISFVYPATWKVNSSDPTKFTFVQNSNGDPLELTLDVPKLPWNPLGWIPIDKVRDGYVDDVKKRMTNAQVTNLPDPTVPDAKQHRVVLTGNMNNQAAVDDAVLLVHGDKVYIFSIESDPASYPQLKKSLEAVVASLKWTK